MTANTKNRILTTDPSRNSHCKKVPDEGRVHRKGQTRIDRMFRRSAREKPPSRKTTARQLVFAKATAYQAGSAKNIANQEETGSSCGKQTHQAALHPAMITRSNRMCECGWFIARRSNELVASKRPSTNARPVPRFTYVSMMLAMSDGVQFWRYTLQVLGRLISQTSLKAGSRLNTGLSITPLKGAVPSYRFGGQIRSSRFRQ